LERRRRLENLKTEKFCSHQLQSKRLYNTRLPICCADLPALSSLDLSGSAIRDAGVADLCAYVRSARCLATLCLDHCKFTAQVCIRNCQLCDRNYFVLFGMFWIQLGRKVAGFMFRF
jgi:hypothetical protein